MVAAVTIFFDTYLICVLQSAERRWKLARNDFFSAVRARDHGMKLLLLLFFFVCDQWKVKSCEKKKLKSEIQSHNPHLNTQNDTKWDSRIQ